MAQRESQHLKNRGKSQPQKRATEVALFHGLTELSSVFPFVHAAGRPEW